MHAWTMNPDETEAVCNHCGYQVICDHDEETKGGSRHVPEEGTIFTDQNTITKKDCDHLARVWGVKCE